jgi:hypothetical protein
METEKPIKEEKKKQKIKTYHIMKPTMTSNDELLLPNGKVYSLLYSVSATANIDTSTSKQSASPTGSANS